MRDLYCKIFVDTKSRHADLVGWVCEILGGRVREYEVSCDALVADVLENDEHGRTGLTGPEFLYYRYFVDIEPNAGIDRDAYIERVRSLVAGLRDRGCSVVAACDFEDELR